ncbi:MAG: AAA family ATPase [Candidatus Sumerlaeia bacterium]|nr:AAA family ATPase [Candidatus Sumerlaeia bacterium]
MTTEIQSRVEEFRSDFERLRAEVGKVIVGMGNIVEGVLIGLFADGHVLLEGVPGLGKTLLVRTLAQALDLEFSRIQFTPDLMPADIIGTQIIHEDAETGRRAFRFERGPVFANILLADEINRATPKTQSALLEAMQERQVTSGGVAHRLDDPFFVMATQNPLEMEGTYPLPEAQLDRFFFKLLVEFPTRAEMATILERTTDVEVPQAANVMDRARVNEWRRLVRQVALAPHVRDYAVRMVLATHPENELATEMVKRFVRYGASPRGAQALCLAGKIRALVQGRYNVGFSDVAELAKAVLRHRLILNFEAEAEGIRPDQVVDSLVAVLPKQAEEPVA